MAKCNIEGKIMGCRYIVKITSLGLHQMYSKHPLQLNPFSCFDTLHTRIKTLKYYTSTT